MLGGFVILGGVGIGVVGRAAVSTGDDDFFLGLFLYIVQEVEEGRIDVLFSFFEGQAVLLHPSTVDDEGGLPIGLFGDRRVVGIALAAEKFFGDFDLVADIGVFPGVILSDEMGGLFDCEEYFVVRTVNVLSRSIHLAQLLSLRVF